MELLEDSGQVPQQRTHSVPTPTLFFFLLFTLLTFNPFFSRYHPPPPCTHTPPLGMIRGTAVQDRKHFLVYLEGLQVLAPTASSVWKGNEKHFFSSSSSFTSSTASWRHPFKHFVAQLVKCSPQNLQLPALHISIASLALIEPPLMTRGGEEDSLQKNVCALLP